MMGRACSVTRLRQSLRRLLVACWLVSLVAAGVLFAASCALTPGGPGRVGAQAAASWQVGAGSDDAHSDDSLYLTDTVVRMGQPSSGRDHTAGFRWTALAIPQASSIATATLEVNVSSVQGSSGWNLTIYAEAADACATFAASSWPVSRTVTSASVNWQPTNSTGWKSSPDIAAVVQEVVNRSGWTAGNSLCLIIKDNQTGTGIRQNAVSYDGSASSAARLYVGYNAPTPTPTATPCPPITSNVTWSGVYTVGCNIGVARGVTLTIAPGTTVKTNGSYRWDIAGALYAVGLPASPITLTAAISTARGSWGPLAILGSAELDYVTMTYGTALDAAGPVTLSHALLMSNSIGVDFVYPGALLSCTVRQNDTGVLVRGNVAPTLRASNIMSNSVDLWNSQAIALALPGLWWGTTVTGTIEGGLRDGMDEIRLGRVQWWPAAAAPW